MSRIVIWGFVLVVIYLALTKKQAPQPITKKIIPAVIKTILTEDNPGEPVSSLADSPSAAGSATPAHPAATFTPPTFNAVEWDLNLRVADLEQERDALLAERDQLLKQLAACQQPVYQQSLPPQPVRYVPAPAAYCTGPNCPPQTRYSPSNNYQRRGIFGWRR